ncbi:MAG: CpaD family pilus assembly lipoprotein [Pseudomonadota bacterium]
MADRGVHSVGHAVLAWPKLLLVLLVLSACTESFGDRSAAAFRADPAEVQVDLFFQPGNSSLASGEVQKVRRILDSLLLQEDDDILVTLPSTGSDVLDNRRITTARRAVSGTPARIRIIRRPGFALAAPVPDAALIQVQRYSLVRVLCPSNGSDFSNEIWGQNDLNYGCSNALNRASMASNVRDLTNPGDLEPVASEPSIRAVQAYRDGNVRSNRVLSVIVPD